MKTTKSGTKKKKTSAPAPSVASPTPVETVLVLRTCDKNLRSYGGFQWPESGRVEAPTTWWGAPGQQPSDLKLGFSAQADCGEGLHGLLWGEGDGGLLSWDLDAKWLVVRVAKADIVDLAGKVKFPAGEVVFCGDQQGATKYLYSAPEGRGRAIAGLALNAERRDEVAASGYYGTSTSGYKGTSTSGYKGTSTSGDYGTSTSGDYGTSTSGDYGTSTSGYKGTSTSGDYGTSTSGSEGVAASGELGTLILRWWDGPNSWTGRWRYVVGYVGEGGIEAGKKYKLDAQHQFVEVP